ncbi:MAG: fused MFS/spermidine synthase, partial [Planctomycetota bacterium]|nr:fused MFS/spermidine synthase [Planctomycetota bacterium]
MPCITVFISSACVMMVELLAFRLITRFLGHSNFTVSAIIGVVLGGLAIGNYVGGRLADRFRARSTLSVLFMLSSGACLAIPALNNLFGEWPALWHLSLPTRIAIHVALTFALPSALLGTMGPILAKMALDQGRQVGRTVGNVYAWGVVGSLVGTFLCGFWLIPNFGLYTVNYAICGVLALMGILFGLRHWWPYAGSAVIVFLTSVALGPWTWSRSLAAEWGMRDREGPEILFDKASEYSHVRVELDPSEPGRRVMMLDKLAHSFYNPDRPDALLYSYETVYD